MRVDLSDGITPASTRVMNLSHFLTDIARRHPDAPGFIWGDQSWSWAQMEARAAAFAEALIERFDVRPPNPDLAARNFSGGNQQKIVVAREVERNPDLLLIGQPTRGVDIGAIEFIHKRIVELRDAGKAVLLVSVELDEIMSLSDRILVMFDGMIMGERDPETTTAGELGLLMAGVTDTPAEGAA